MCKINDQVISILNDIIYTHNLDPSKYKEVEWRELFESAEKKGLLPIIFREVSNSKILSTIDKTIINEFKNKSVIIEKENKNVTFKVGNTSKTKELKKVYACSK